MQDAKDLVTDVVIEKLSEALDAKLAVWDALRGVELMLGVEIEEELLTEMGADAIEPSDVYAIRERLTAYLEG